MNYGFYKSTFGGTLIPPELFTRFALKAETFLQSATLGREIPSPYLEKVPYALCEIAECFFRRRNSSALLREDSAMYSVSFKDTSLYSELNEIVSLYFGESGVLFKGEPYVS